MNRWWVSAVWMGLVMALVSASTQGAFGVAALWALPAALVVTVVGMGWPDKPIAKLVGLIGVVWQLALIGAYWPFAASVTVSADAMPMHWPAHMIVILVVLLLLAMSFVALFLLPAVSLRAKVQRATRMLATRAPDALDQVADSFRADMALSRLWQEYVGQTREADGKGPASAHLSARAVFDPATVTHARLRLEFFRNLPGVFTGTGIIGTFTGLIMGLRSFRISQDPGVVQRSLEALLSGVWEAFLVSAVAIALAIVVTVIEKLTMSAVYRQLDDLALTLDGLYPPRPQAENAAAWLPQLLEAVSTLRSSTPRGATSLAQSAAQEPARAASPHAAMTPPAAMVPMSSMVPMSPMSPTPSTLSSTALHPGPLSAVPAAELHHALLDSAAQSRAALQAMTEMARALPELLAGPTQSAAQAQLQASQALKALSARLEGVASSIELSGRKTLETVAARLMQSEMNMVSRHHAVADHLGELVQRIEALCGLLQQDRADFQQDPQDDDGPSQAPDYGTRWGAGAHDEGARSSRVGAQWGSAASGNGHHNTHGNAYANAQRPGPGSAYAPAGEDEAWPEHQPRNEGGFGS